MLRNVPLMRLLGGFAALNVAEWAFVTALSIFAYREGGTLAVGLIGLRLVGGAASSALLAPLVAHRRGVLGSVTALRALVLATAAALVKSGAGFGAALPLVVLDSVAAGPYRPAQSRLLPGLARSPAQLSLAAAEVSMVKTLGQALGALLGGVGVALVSPGKAMAGAAGLMVLAALITFGLSDERLGWVESSSDELALGLAAFPAVLRDATASPIVVASVLRTLVRGLWMALLVVVALRLLDLGSSGVGLLQAAAGIGAALAVPITASLIGRPRLGLPCAVAFVFAGITVSLIGATPIGDAAIALVCVWGISMAVADATSLSLLHRLLDPGALSRAVGVMESLKLSAEGLGALLAPALVAIFGLRPALVVAGLPLPLVVMVYWPQLRLSDLLAEGRSELVALLHGLQVFRGLDMASLENVASRVRRMEVRAGTDVVTVGEPGDSYYVIETGQAEVIVGGYAVGQLGRGHGFGERALLRDSPRTATVRGLTDLSLLAIGRGDFISAATGAQSRESPGGPALGAASNHGQLTAGQVIDVLSDIALLSELDRSSLEELAGSGVYERWPPDTVVIREGDLGDTLYVVVSGRALMSIGGLHQGELLPGDSFGEIAVLHHTARAATITADADLVTLALPGPQLLAARDARLKGAEGGAATQPSQ
jgi:CRP-like cAMP-binding protein